MIRSKDLYGTKPDGTHGKPGDPGMYDVSPQGAQTYLMVHPDSTGGRLDSNLFITNQEDRAKLFNQTELMLPLFWTLGLATSGGLSNLLISEIFLDKP
jgi:hypothetical protein